MYMTEFLLTTLVVVIVAHRFLDLFIAAEGSKVQMCIVWVVVIGLLITMFLLW